MSNPNVQLFSELLGGPLGELISSVGRGVGEAQAALDHGALMQTLDLYDISKDEDRSPEELNLINLVRALGYQPTFYAIPETEVEAQISLSMDIKSEQTSPVGGFALSKYKINATPLNAGNVNRFGLQANAMAKLKFKIVPVPPNSGVSELRVIPDLTVLPWDEARELLQNLGLTYELRDVHGRVITSYDLELDGHPVASHLPIAGSVSSTNTPLVITIDVQFKEVPDITGAMWWQGTRDLLFAAGFGFYELRDVDGNVITDVDADAYPVTAQSPAAGNIANTNYPVIVTVDVNAF